MTRQGRKGFQIGTLIQPFKSRDEKATRDTRAGESNHAQCEANGKHSIPEPTGAGCACARLTPTGAPPTIYPSVRSTSSTIALLKKPLKREHVKPRLLGHWGTTPGLNFIYVHLNRIIKEQDLSVIFVTGPGHGGPGIVANTWLEGTYSEVYPNISQDEEGMQKLFKQFSFPGGIPSHVAPETPGSIHEGGELGYALSHAYGAAFDNPNLIVATVVGDGEAETGPLATGWHGNKFLNPVRDGAVLPILHLNGYKIANPCFLARIPQDELRKLFEGYGYKPYFVEGHEPEKMHQLMAEALDAAPSRFSAFGRKPALVAFKAGPRGQ